MQIESIPLIPDIDTFFNGSYFHYTSINSLEQIINNNSLRFTRSDFLNDRNEIIHSINLLKQVYNNHNWNHLYARKFKVILRLINSFIKNSFILSLSINKDSLALWGIYSNFTGYNIQMNLKSSIIIFGKNRS